MPDRQLRSPSSEMKHWPIRYSIPGVSELTDEIAPTAQKGGLIFATDLSKKPDPVHNAFLTGGDGKSNSRLSVFQYRK